MSEESLNEHNSVMVLEWSDRGIAAARSGDVDTLHQVVQEVVASGRLPHLLSLWASMLYRWGDQRDDGPLSITQVLLTIEDPDEDQQRTVTELLVRVLSAHAEPGSHPSIETLADELVEEPWGLLLSLCASLATSLEGRFPAHVPASVVSLVTEWLTTTNEIHALLTSEETQQASRAVIGLLTPDGSEGAQLLRPLAETRRRGLVELFGRALASQLPPGSDVSTELIDGMDMGVTLSVGTLSSDTTDLDSLNDPTERAALLAALFLRALAAGEPDQAWKHYERVRPSELGTMLFFLGYWVGHNAHVIVTQARSAATE